MTAHLSEAAFAQMTGAPAPKRSKYRAVPVIVTEAGELYEAKAAKANGIAGQRFDSKAEARRYLKLKALEKAGRIGYLVRQPVFVIHASDDAETPVASYRADFSYDAGDGKITVEDVKGIATPLYRLKKKLVEAEYGVRILEVPA